MRFFRSLLILAEAPGVALHEVGHALFCWVANLRIDTIRFFQFGDPAGYVIHEEPRGVIAATLVAFGPLFMNSGAALFCFSFTSHWPAAYAWGAIWLGIAAGLHSIPSTGDAKTLFHLINRRFWRNPLLILGYPFALVIAILNLLKRIHLHWLYTLALWWAGATYIHW